MSAYVPERGKYIGTNLIKNFVTQAYSVISLVTLLSIDTLVGKTKKGRKLHAYPARNAKRASNGEILASTFAYASLNRLH